MTAVGVVDVLPLDYTSLTYQRMPSQNGASILENGRSWPHKHGRFCYLPRAGDSTLRFFPYASKDSCLGVTAAAEHLQTTVQTVGSDSPDSSRVGTECVLADQFGQWSV